MLQQQNIWLIHRHGASGFVRRQVLNTVCCRLQKKSQESINARLALVMKSGKFTLGSKTCLKTLRSGKGVYEYPADRVPCVDILLTVSCSPIISLLSVIRLIFCVVHSQADSHQQQLPAHQEDRD